MSELTPEAVKHQVTIYVRVFLVLATLTVLTVGVSYLRLPIAVAVAVALGIAFVKGSLVAGYFMHLVSEKKIIYSILALAAFFFLFLLIYPSIFHL